MTGVHLRCISLGEIQTCQNHLQKQATSPKTAKVQRQDQRSHIPKWRNEMKELFLEFGVKGSDRKPVVTPRHLVFSHETGQRSPQPSTNLSFMAEWPDRRRNETSVEHFQVSQTLWSESSWSGGIRLWGRLPGPWTGTGATYRQPATTQVQISH